MFYIDLLVYCSVILYIYVLIQNKNNLMALTLKLSKRDICKRLGVDVMHFNDHYKRDFPEWAEIKYKKFTDKEAFDIIKRYRGLYSDEKIVELIYNFKNTAQIGFK